MQEKLPYDNAFYQGQMSGSLRSAQRYVSHFADVFRPHRVVDVGCGRGMWLKAFQALGVETLVGLDGPWNHQDNMVDASIRFIQADLNSALDPGIGRFDVAMSLEVAEHLRPTSADAFVKSLSLLADVVIFGAAYPGQGGTDHINEQRQSVWARRFLDQGFTPYDFFRPRFWGDQQVEYWYRQNTFLYVKEQSDWPSTLLAAGYPPIHDIALMDCVHPEMFEHALARAGIRAACVRAARRVVPHTIQRIFGITPS